MTDQLNAIIDNATDIINNVRQASLFNINDILDEIDYLAGQIRDIASEVTEREQG